MTVIAWDGRMVAADSLATFGGYRGPKHVKKIRQVGNRVYGITGLGAWFEAWIGWFEKGADPKAIPVTSIPHHDTGNFIIFEGTKAWIVNHGLPYPDEIEGPDAWGCGGDFAIGAMRQGADAKRAVEIAIECSPSCGGPIEVIDMQAVTPKKARRAA